MKLIFLLVLLSGLGLIGCTPSPDLDTASSVRTKNKAILSKSINNKIEKSESEEPPLPPKPLTDDSSQTNSSVFTGNEPYLKYLNFDELREAFIIAGFSLDYTCGQWYGYEFLAQNEYGDIEVVEIVKKSPKLAQSDSEERILQLEKEGYIITWSSIQEKSDEEFEVLINQIVALFNSETQQYEYVCIDGHRMYYFRNVSPQNIPFLHSVLQILGFTW